MNDKRLREAGTSFFRIRAVMDTDPWGNSEWFIEAWATKGHLERGQSPYTSRGKSFAEALTEVQVALKEG